MKLNYFSLNTTLLGLSRLNNNVVKRRNTTVIPPSPSRPEGLIGQYKPYLNSNDSPTRSTLKDYSGQGHDIQLYNFGYAGMSGYNPVTGTLQYVKSSDEFSEIISRNVYSFKFQVTKDVTRSGILLGTISFLEGTGISKGSYIFKNKSSYDIAFGNYNLTEASYTINSGITKIEVEEYTGTGSSYFIYSTGAIPAGTIIEIEQLSYYPGALVSDGVDDYGLCKDFPQLTLEKGYTVCAIRKKITENSTGVLVSTRNNNIEGTGSAAFVMDKYTSSGAACYSYSFNVATNVDIVDDDFVYQTKNSYCGQAIQVGSLVLENPLLLFAGYYYPYLNDKVTEFGSFALYALEIYDHDLTDEEIQSVKEAMYNEYLTATNALQNHIIADYECYDKTNEDEDRDVLKDLSGNGNDITLYNFGFAEGSGYGKYTIDYNQFSEYTDRAEIVKTSSSIRITNVFKVITLIEHQLEIQMPSYKVRVTGISGSGKTLRYDASQYPSKNSLVISEDGIYDLPASDISSQYSGGFRVLETGPCNITIEQIPEYQGALVSDGIDDYGLCENFPILNKEDGYTVLAIRKWIGDIFAKQNSFLSIGNTALTVGFENQNGGIVYSASFSTDNNVTKEFNSDSYFSYQTNERYNNLQITSGSLDVTQNDKLVLFRRLQTNERHSNVAFYRAIILNKNCTTEEIKFLAKQMVAKHKEKTGETITLNI